MPQSLPAAGAVDFRGFVHILRHGLQSCDINNHHIADLLPCHHDDQTPEAIRRIGDQRLCCQTAQQCVKNQFPDIAQNDTADQVRHEKDGTEQVGAFELLRERVGQCEGDYIDNHDRHDGIQRGKFECVQESGVLERADVVLDSVPMVVHGGSEFTK